MYMYIHKHRHHTLIDVPIYMTGGKINIILDPNTAPAMEPTKPISLHCVAIKLIPINNIAVILCTVPTPLITLLPLLLAFNTNQFLIARKISGKLANTEVPKATLDIVPKLSVLENPFSAKPGACTPNILSVKYTVVKYIIPALPYDKIGNKPKSFGCFSLPSNSE